MARKSEALVREEHRASELGRKADLAMDVLREIRAGAAPVYEATFHGEDEIVRVSLWAPWRANGGAIMVEGSVSAPVVYGEEILIEWSRLDPMERTDAVRQLQYWLRDSVVAAVREAARKGRAAWDALPSDERRAVLRRSPLF